MKNLRIILIVIMSATMVTSCVSNRKYKEAVNSGSNWKQKYDDLQSDYTKLQGDKQSLEASMSASIKNKEDALSDKEKALNDEERKLQEMKSLIDAQRNAIRNLKQEVCSALKCFTPDELTVEVRDGKLYVSMSDKLLFPSGSDVVNARGKEAISMLAAVLTNSDLEIMIEGHTDNVPISSARNKDNWDLSTHRATSVIRIFTADGIPSDRIIASGRGEYHPLADNTSAQGRQSNRRTEIVLAPKLDKLWKLTEQEDITSDATKK